MLSGLKADDSEQYKKAFEQNDTSSSEEDEDANDFVQRRLSMNVTNEVGMDFNKY